MRADLSLKGKQAFWETPRNIALLLTAVAAIFGFLRFKLGNQRKHPPSAAMYVHPRAAGDLRASARSFSGGSFGGC